MQNSKYESVDARNKVSEGKRDHVGKSRRVGSHDKRLLSTSQLDGLECRVDGIYQRSYKAHFYMGQIQIPSKMLLYEFSQRIACPWSQQLRNPRTAGSSSGGGLLKAYMLEILWGFLILCLWVKISIRYYANCLLVLWQARWSKPVIKQLANSVALLRPWRLSFKW